MRFLIFCFMLFSGSLPGAPAFVAAAAGEQQAAAATVVSGTMNVVSGNFLFVFHRSQNSCSAGASAAIPSDTAGNAWYPVPGSGSAITRIIVTAGGSGYSGGTTVTITGGGGSGATAMPNLVSGVVTSISITNTGSGYTGVPTVTITGGGGSGATARILTMSINNSGPPTCSQAWYAYNAIGHSSNAVTVTTNAQSFHGVSVQQWSGVKATDPLHATASAVISSGSTITSGSFSTSAETVALFGVCNESLSNSWTPGAGYTIPTGATNASGYATSQYRVLASGQSGVTATATSTALAKTILGGAFEVDQGGGGGAPVPSRRRVITN